MNKLFQSIAFRCLLALAGFQVIGCGQADDSALDQEDLGSVKEAFSGFGPAGQGFGAQPRSGTYFDQCFSTDPVSDTCFASRTKSLKVNSMQLLGGCAGSFWQTNAASAESLWNNENIPGNGNTGYVISSSGTTIVDMVCDAGATMFPGLSVQVSPTAPFACSGRFCEFSRIKVIFQGNTIVNACKAHPEFNCNVYLQNLVLRGLYLATGASWHEAGIALLSRIEPDITEFGSPPQFTALGGDFQRMHDYVP